MRRKEEANFDGGEGRELYDVMVVICVETYEELKRMAAERRFWLLQRGLAS